MLEWKVLEKKRPYDTYIKDNYLIDKKFIGSLLTVHLSVTSEKGTLPLYGWLMGGGGRREAIGRPWCQTLWRQRSPPLLNIHVSMCEMNYSSPFAREIKNSSVPSSRAPVCDVRKRNPPPLWVTHRGGGNRTYWSTNDPLTSDIPLPEHPRIDVWDELFIPGGGGNVR